MRIACSSTSEVPSEKANSIQVVLACQALRDCGQTVRLWVPGEGKVEHSGIRSQYGLNGGEFEISRLTSRPRLRRTDFTLAALHEAEKWNADLVYTWTIQIADLASRRGLPVVYEAHDLPQGTFGVRWFRGFTRSKNKKRVMFITTALRDQVLKAFPDLKPEECLISPNGVNLGDYDNLQRHSGTDRLMVSCSGHLYAGRGVELFLKLAEAFPNINFCWYGGRPEDVEKYRGIAASMALENVEFTGFIPRSELPQRQADSDILIMPYEMNIAGSSGGNSSAICSPMKMFEYMAVQRPILASDLPVIHEVLNENSAVFCKPGDLSSWQQGLQKLIDSAELRRTLAEKAYASVGVYSWNARAQAVLDSLQS